MKRSVILVASVVNCFAISGIDAYVVNIETDTIYGQPSVSIVGLGDTSVKESRERLEASINHEKYEFPKMKIVINLAPCDMRKSGSHFDLGMAVGILLQTNQVFCEDLSGFGFIGELYLNGQLRPSIGILPMAIEAKRKGIKNLIVPKENYREANLVKGLNIFAFEKLKDVITFLQDKKKYEFTLGLDIINNINNLTFLDFKDVQGLKTAAK